MGGDSNMGGPSTPILADTAWTELATLSELRRDLLKYRAKGL